MRRIGPRLVEGGEADPGRPEPDQRDPGSYPSGRWARRAAPARTTRAAGPGAVQRWPPLGRATSTRAVAASTASTSRTLSARRARRRPLLRNSPDEMRAPGCRLCGEVLTVPGPPVPGPQRRKSRTLPRCWPSAGPRSAQFRHSVAGRSLGAGEVGMATRVVLPRHVRPAAHPRSRRMRSCTTYHAVALTISTPGLGL